MSDTLTGRALDASLAAKLFNWTEVKPEDWYGYPPDEQAKPPGCETLLPVPDYSASWAGAGEVIDEMRRRGYRVVIEDWQERGWCVLFTFPNGHDTGQILGDAIGEAVCRAALAASGPSASELAGGK